MIPVASLKILGASGAVATVVLRVFFAQLEGLSEPMQEVLTGTGVAGFLIVLTRLALAGFRGVKHGEDEFARKELQIVRLEAQVAALQAENATLIRATARAEAALILAEAEIDGTET